jgi:hypothetical protein
MAWAAAFGLLAAAMPARSECTSPSAEAATSTTVYRCPEGNASAAKGPIIVDPSPSTILEREPKPTPTSDPIVAPVTATPEKQETPPTSPEKQLAAPDKQAAPPERQEEAVRMAPVPEEATDAKDAKDAPEEPTATKAESKTKAAEAKPAKPKRKAKLAKSQSTKKKVVKAKPAKAKVAQTKQTKTKTKTAKPQQAPEEEIKTEPAKSDNNVIVMTKKDMTVGNRIKSWLGF